MATQDIFYFGYGCVVFWVRGQDINVNRYNSPLPYCFISTSEKFIYVYTLYTLMCIFICIYVHMWTYIHVYTNLCIYFSCFCYENL
jgi:hypothetical protein